MVANPPRVPYGNVSNSIFLDDTIFTMNYNELEKVKGNLRYLESVGLPTKEPWKWLSEWEEQQGRRSVTESDLAWPLLPPIPLSEHLTGTERPLLSCQITMGRMYRLSAAQRSVLREWYNMIPSEVVTIVEIAALQRVTSPLGEDKGLVPLHVVISTVEHIDPKNKRLVNGPRKVTIDRWGDFMQACLTRENEMEETRKWDSYFIRVNNLLQRARKEGYRSHLQAGTVATAWQSQVDTNNIVDPDLIRQELVAIISWQDPELLKYMSQRKSKEDKENASLDSALDDLMKGL